MTEKIIKEVEMSAEIAEQIKGMLNEYQILMGEFKKSLEGINDLKTTIMNRNSDFKLPKFAPTPTPNEP